MRGRGKRLNEHLRLSVVEINGTFGRRKKERKGKWWWNKCGKWHTEVETVGSSCFFQIFSSWRDHRYEVEGSRQHAHAHTAPAPRSQDQDSNSKTLHRVFEPNLAYRSFTREWHDVSCNTKVCPVLILDNPMSHVCPHLLGRTFINSNSIFVRATVSTRIAAARAEY